jgi:hypothetical protein
MTMNRFVLCIGMLIEFQICCSVLVQPSCFVLPHIPWLSGVAAVHLKPVVIAAAGTGERGGAGVATASGLVDGSVPQPATVASSNNDGILGMRVTRALQGASDDTGLDRESTVKVQ